MQKKSFNTYLNPRVSIGWHVLFWLAFLLYQAVILGLNEGRSVLDELKWAAMDLPVQILTTYFTIYFLIPRFFVKKQYLKFALAFFFTLFLASFLNRSLYYLLFNPLLYASPAGNFFDLPMTFKMIFGLYPVVVLGSFIKMGQLWHEREQMNQQLINDKLQAELKFLKAQVNPHFLFNTLNNLYALTLKKSDKASEVVEKLSGMLEYVLYGGDSSRTTIEEEVELLKNYILLEKIRYGERLEVLFELEGDLKEKTIPPLLLLPFVENSFKHGASRQLEAAYIHIFLKITGHRLKLRVINSKRRGVPKLEQGKTNGIGLENVKKRLDLLFEKNYCLEILDLDEKFQIDLEIPLDKNLNRMLHETHVLHNR